MATTNHIQTIYIFIHFWVLFDRSACGFSLDKPYHTLKKNRNGLQSSASSSDIIPIPVNGEKTNGLTFLSEFEAQSSPLTPTSPEATINFFRQPEHLSFGKSMPSEVVAPTADMVEAWFAAYKKLGIKTLPKPEQDLILRVRTAGIKFPGLTVEWSAHIGTRLFLAQHKSKDDDDDNNNSDEMLLPTLEFVLIKDEMSASGVKPLLWMFETATSKKRRSNNQNRDTKFLSQISIRPSNKDGKYMFACNGTMEMRFSIPSVLHRVMGKDKPKHESRISKLITRQIEKDMVKAVAKWQETYEIWLQSKKGSHV